MFGGLLCETFNAFSFGFEVKLHWTLRLIITILAVTFAPVIFMIGSIIVFPLLYKDFIELRRRVLCCIRAPSNKLLALLWVIAYIIQFLMLFALWIAGAVISLVLGIVPFYICIVIVLVRLLFRWCLGSKSKQ